MKLMLLFFAATGLLISCSNKEITTIVIENILDFDRKGEIVEVTASLLKADLKTKTYVLRDSKGNEVDYQIISNDTNQLIIFQADVPAKSSAIYILSEGVPATVTPKTHARFVPERKDDFSWENDIAAYRMYGPALAPENPSNGVDLWLKCTEELVADKFYADDIERGITYHENNGLGLDCYDVKHTAGAGGIAPYTTKLWTGDNFNRYEIAENGPLRSVFTLMYDSVVVDGEIYREIITITADAGSMLNKGFVRYIGADRPTMRLAAGINLHDGKGNMYSDNANRVIGYAEDAISTKKIPQGRNYVGVYIPEANSNSFEEDNHLLITADYPVGTGFTYYFGGGWSQWKFPTDEDWFNALVLFGKTKQSPLKVTIQ